MDTADITQHEFFSTLDDEVLSVLLDNISEVTAPKGEYLFRQDEVAERFFLIKAGDIKVGYQMNQMLINQRTLQPGDVIGWSWLIPPYRWSTTALAESETQVYAFDGIELLVECEKDPRIGYALFKRFAGMMGQRLAVLHDPGFGRERRRGLHHMIDSIAKMEEDPRNRKRFLAI